MAATPWPSPKTITVGAGLYPELLMLRNVANLSIVGESRAGVIVGDVNFEVAQQRQWRVGHQRHHDPLHLGQGRRPPTASAAGVRCFARRRG